MHRERWIDPGRETLDPTLRMKERRTRPVQVLINRFLLLSSRLCRLLKETAEEDEDRPEPSSMKEMKFARLPEILIGDLELESLET
ncbi:hypothetical protein MTR_5g057885 [Medicago truncatula]|uniref:Uncharacterized protein n=1 Tax=Medicago truncatula TaxID=3880 RepID=A0A072UQ81_MEDTR|nr:hypothetical protein MTR_5g057885 [Medicago truncatula]